VPKQHPAIQSLNFVTIEISVVLQLSVLKTKKFGNMLPLGIVGLTKQKGANCLARLVLQAHSETRLFLALHQNEN